MALALQRHVKPRYPRVPILNGFCLAIRRQAINAVGRDRLRRSDFSLWQNDRLQVLTDYYPEAQSLIVHWSLTDEKRPAFMESLMILLDRPFTLGARL